MDEDQFEVEPGPPPGVGDQLRAAREARGLSLEQVASETRIPQRHLVTMEAGDFASLPGRTYAVGFARTYAKMLGLDSDEVANGVRAELDAQDFDPRHRPASFEPGDPARLPSRMLGWLSIIAVILVLAGLFVFYRTFFTPAGELPSLLDQQKAEQQQAAAARAKAQAATAAQPAVPSGGAVMFTAIEDGVWVKFSDASGKQLMQKTLAKGESFTLPADAQDPRLWTGRPQALAITVGGQPVPKLSETEHTMKNVPVSAQALLARTQATPTASPPPAAISTRSAGDVRTSAAPAPTRSSPLRPPPTRLPQAVPPASSPAEAGPSPTPTV